MKRFSTMWTGALAALVLCASFVPAAKADEYNRPPELT
jgi:hypothetical protein